MKKLTSAILITAIGLCPCLVGACAPDESGTPVKPPEKPIAEFNNYVNPIYPLIDGEKKTTYQADPYAVRDDDGTYYLYCTQTDAYTPTLAFKRGPIWKSIDMHSWEYVGDVFEDYAPDWGTRGAGVWAPTVIKVGDAWNYYYSLSTGGDANPGIGVATSPTPYGPWTHHGKLFLSEEIGVVNSIDPHVLYDDGKLYMVFGSFGGLITLIELTDDGLGLKNGLEWQKQNKIALGGYEINEPDNYEGSLIIKREGYYYLFLSTGTCLSGINSTYRVVCARAESITGPYLDSSGRDMFGPKRGDPVVVPSVSGAMGVGHCTVVTDDADEYWMLYHGYDTTSATPEFRVMYLDKLIWDDATGMPHVENNKASNGTEKPGPYINGIENNT